MTTGASVAERAAPGLPAPPGPRWVRALPDRGVLEGCEGNGLLAGNLPGGLAAWADLYRLLEENRPAEGRTEALVEAAVEVWRRPGFETFVCLPRLSFQPFPHQLQAAEVVLRRMRGRALLADEVGLGKTIEAGLVLSELRLRGLASRVLVVVPAGLVEQWREELERKFTLPTALAGDGRGRGVDAGGEGAGEAPVLLASLAAARRPPLRGAITGTEWDVVVVDEAHRCKNPQSASSRLVRGLRSRYLLLLTATPVENRLSDLYHLLNLVRPGHLGTPAEFRARHGAAGDGPVRDLPALRARTREVMVRHRRSEVSLWLPDRLAETLVVRPGPEEAGLYRRVSDRVRDSGRGAPPDRIFALRAVQRLAGSSPRALVPTLCRLGWDDLAEAAGRLPATEKARALLSLLARHRGRNEQVVVFTAFRQTLELLGELAEEAGMPAVLYHGGLSRRAKEAAVGAFAGGAPVLLTTEAAGEGRNLQFCHVLVNFDVPWNPLQIEQRLGRLHRIGQEHDVVVTNLVTGGTLEERILSVLEAKLNLFELVVGELDMILGRVRDDFDFEAEVFSAHVGAHGDEDLSARLAVLGDELARARASYLATRGSLDDLVPEAAAG